MLNIGIEGFVLCVEKITTVVTFRSYCWAFEILSLVFVFTTAWEMKFKTPSEMDTETEQDCRRVKRIRVM